MNNDLISRSELKDRLAKHQSILDFEWDNNNLIASIIDNAPTVEPPKQLVLRARDDAELEQLKTAWGKGDINFTPIVAWIERPQGEWIFKNGKYRCSHCGEKAIYGFNGACSIKQTELLTDFCWKCGAKMKRNARMKGGTNE